MAGEEYKCRRAFSVWLRTGRGPVYPTGNGLEFKFNPWHDPEDGRFTFAGTGRYYGRNGGGAPTGSGRVIGSGDAALGRLQSRTDGVAGNSGSPAMATVTARDGLTAQSQSSAARSSTQDRWTGGGFTGGGGGRTGGGGATATGTWPDAHKRPPASPGPAAAKRSNRIGNAPMQASVSSGTNSAEQFRTIVRNGYTYHIDTRGRTRRVSGTVTLAASKRRSRTSQGRAGGTDRRATDDGGHYIAARFNGPTEAFNHFAQDLNFNRGRYRALEDQWARAKRNDKNVSVSIVPYFEGESSRPSIIDVWFIIDGFEQSIKLPNEPAGKPNGNK